MPLPSATTYTISNGLVCFPAFALLNYSPMMIIINLLIASRSSRDIGWREAVSFPRAYKQIQLVCLYRQIFELIIMLKLLVLAILIPSLSSQCNSLCSSCLKFGDPYSCTSCASDQSSIYIFSCPQNTAISPAFMVIAVVITLLHLFMIAIGIGIYRDTFENIQLASLISWRYNFQQGTVSLQGTNLGFVRGNSFYDSYGGQFIVIMVILAIFWILLFLVDKITHNPTAILIRRKKIIFPTRVITFFFNILYYASLIQISTLRTESSLTTFTFALAILALIKVVVVLVGLAITSNWTIFQAEDPNYYVLLEEMTTKKWYAKNSVLISLLVRGTIISAFVLSFQNPQTAGIAMLVAQIVYCLYFIILLRFNKARYFFILMTGNLIMVGIIITSFMGASQTVGSPNWSQMSTAYVILILLLVVLYFVSTIIQLVARREQINKQVKSIYNRFIRCEKLEEKVKVNKYDDNSHREKVQNYQKNLLYQQELTKDDKGIQLTNSF